MAHTNVNFQVTFSLGFVRAMRTCERRLNPAFVLLMKNQCLLPFVVGTTFFTHESRSW
ncbi:unnamed protein product, partial [Nesidiocoris tenuis]